MAITQFVRFQTVVVDESKGQTYKFSRTYGLDEGVPFFDFVGLNLLNACAAYWDKIKAALLPVMHAQQFVSQIAGDYWSGLGEDPGNASPILYTPVDSVVGVSSFVAGNYGGNSAFLNYRLGLKLGGQEEHMTLLGFGNPVRKAASWRVPCSSTMFDSHGYMSGVTARALAVTLATRFQEVLDVDEVPLLTLPGFAAVPVCTSFVYTDEAIGGDPDSTNNLHVRAFWEGQSVSVSSLIRNKKTSTPEAYYGA